MSEEYLQGLGCCPRCVLIYNGVRDLHHYATPEAVASATQALASGELQAAAITQMAGKDAKQINGDGQNGIAGHVEMKSLSEERKCDEANTNNGSSDAVLQQNTVCVSCLGLLQDDCCSTEIIQKVCAPSLAAGYDAPSFLLSVSLPVSVTARSHIIAALHGQRCTSTQGKQRDTVTALLKDVWKAVTGPAVAALLGKTLSAVEAPLTVAVAAQCGGDADDCQAVMKAIGYTGPQVKKQRNHKHRFYKYKHKLNDTSDREVSTTLVEGTSSDGTTAPCDSQPRTAEFSRMAVESALAAMTSQQLAQCCPLPPAAPTTPLLLTPQPPSHAPVFVAGRYCKYSRELSQTPWIINGVLKCASSVEELIAGKLLVALQATEFKFLSSGREDVDVRCLGRGRPFALEVRDPRVTTLSLDTMRSLQQQINDSTDDISVSHLQMLDKESTSVLRFNTADKVKSYCALCCVRRGCVTEEMLQGLRCAAPVTIQQQTPLRVLHRRPLLTRPRTVHTMEVQWLDHKFFKLYMRSEAGTYIKELVHGDFGRTLPSLSSLLGLPVDIIALDVMDVELDWPPVVEDPLP